MRVAVLGDIGQEIYRVGDEAMTHAVSHALSQRGMTPVLLTRSAERTRRDHGGRESFPALTFPHDEEWRIRFLTEIRDVLAGHPDRLPPTNQLFAFRESLAQCDALVIAGGGNLNSRYGWLLYERLASIAVARDLGLPVVITGQTLGPVLSRPDTRHAREELARALVLGAREPWTYARATQLLGPERVHAVLDDASFLAEVPLPHLDVRRKTHEGREAAGEPEFPASGHAVVPGAVVATLAPGTLGYDDEHLALVARVLDTAAERVGAPVHLVPHMGRVGERDGDAALHDRLADLMSSDVSSLPIEHALVAARRAREAGLVLTSRYHPAIFALEGGVPVVGISPEGYTRVQLAGALERWDLPRRLVVDTLAAPESLAATVEAVMAQRSRVRSELAARRERAGERVGAFWDLVAETLRSGQAPTPAPPVDAQPIELDYLPAPPPDPTAPAVSVVMRTKERPMLLRRALDDVAAQTFGDLELIVVNDAGDPAEVEAVVAESDALDGRLRVLHRPESAGMEAASNAGLARARGEFVVIHDDDDTWHPAFLAETVGYLRAHPDVRAVSGRTQIVWERIEPDRELPVVEARELFHGELDEITVSDELRNNHMVPISLLYRRSVHEEIGLYDEDLPVIGDWDFNLRLTRLGPVPIVGHQPLAFWRQRRAARGVLGNSVIDQRRTHLSFDRRLREARLRGYLDEHGDGALLHLTDIMWRNRVAVLQRVDKSVEQVKAHLDGESQRELRELVEHVIERQEALEAHLDRLAEATAEQGVVALLRRKYWAARTRLGLLPWRR